MIELEWRLIEAGHCTHPEASSRVGASWRSCEFPALVALLRHPNLGWMLFDTGYGDAFFEATRRLPESIYRRVTPVALRAGETVAAQLARDGLSADSIGHVIVSHFHGDHVGALADFGRSTVWCSQAGWDELHGRSRIAALARGLLPALAPTSIYPRVRHFEHAPRTRLPADLAPFGEGHDLFGDGSVRAIPLPGHAVGQFGVVFRARGHWIFLVADAAWSRRAIDENAPPPRWATAMLGDTQAYRRTLSDLHALAARRNDVVLVPAHCRSFRP